MKIVLVGKYNQSEILSGPEKFAKRLYTTLKKLGHQVVFIDYYFKGRKNSTLFSRLFGFSKLQSDNNVNQVGIIRLIFHLIIRQYDIIHIVTFERFVLPIFLYKYLLKGRIVSTVHGIQKFEKDITFIRRKRFDLIKDLILEKLIVKFSDRIVFVSNLLLDKVQEYYVINLKKIEIIYNGVDEIFYNSSKKFDNLNPLKIVFYDGITKYIDRGVNNLFDQLDKLHGIEIEVYLITTDVYLKKRDSNIKIIHTPPMNTKDLAIFLQDKHICIKTDKFDSFPIFALECLMAGLILIVTENVGIYELIINGGNGFIYNNRSSSLIKIIRTIYDKEIDSKQISLDAVKTAQSHVWEKVAKDYFETYFELNSL